MRVLVPLLFLLLLSLPARGGVWRLGEVEGILNLRLSYGLLVRTESRDDDLVGIANGGNAESVNWDDGTLNYDKGIASNVLRGTGELGARWRNLGVYVRAFAFYDFEQDLADRERTDLSSSGRRTIGWDVDVRDYYVNGRFQLAGAPIQVRVGDQVLNWGESRLLRFGVDLVNPTDFVAVFQPAATARDLQIPEGMVWAAASLSEEISVEGFYQYDWEPVRLPPVGSLFSTNDTFGAEGTNIAVIGNGRFSDLGTDLDDAFGLPSGTLGFDADFSHIPGRGTNDARDQGQFGFTVRAVLPALNSTKLALHFINYHSRRPLVNGVTASQEAIEQTSQPAVDARAAELAPIYEGTGLDPTEAALAAQAAASALTVGEFATESGYFARYPEDVQMLGFSFNTALPRVGTLVSGEVSHHFDAPQQVWVQDVVRATLSPIQFDSFFGEGPLGSYGADQVVRGFIRRDRTQLELGLTQLLGPGLGAVQSVLSFDLGWVHIHDIPDKSDRRLNAPGLTPSSPRSRFPTANSLGYRFVAQMIYAGVFGGFTVRPRVVWNHDFHGVTPGPLGAFVEDRKAISGGVSIDYTKTWTADLSYTSFFGAGRHNLLRDRDFFAFNVSWNY